MLVTLLLITTCASIEIDQGFLGKWWEVEDANIPKPSYLENACFICYEAPTTDAGDSYLLDQDGYISGPAHWWRLSDSKIEVESLGTLEVNSSSEAKASVTVYYNQIPFQVDLQLCAHMYED